MTSTQSTVLIECTTDPSDIRPLAQVIAEAFHNLLPSGWLVPDDKERAQIFPAWFQLYVEAAMAEGWVHTTPERNAVALWFNGVPEVPHDHYEHLAGIVGAHLHRFVRFDWELDRRHPSGPHHWLPIIAVKPGPLGAQGLGIGSALLDFHHNTLDPIGTPVYLEAADLRSRGLYLRHGYRDHGDPFVLPDGGPPMYPMWRVPQPIMTFGVPR